MLSKISLAINVVLIIAVAILFSRTSKSTSSVETPDAPVASAFASGDSVRVPIVAYVNADSLNEKYKFISEKTKSLEANLRSSDEKIQREYAKREKEWNELMAYAQSKQLPDDEAAMVEQRLATLQGEMDKIQNDEKNQLMQSEAKLQEELHKRVELFLESFTKKKGIDYVLNYSVTTPVVLYGNPAYDVTSEVLSGLNAEYEQEKASEKK